MRHLSGFNIFRKRLKGLMAKLVEIVPQHRNHVKEKALHDLQV